MNKFPFRRCGPLLQFTGPQFKRDSGLGPPREAKGLLGKPVWNTTTREQYKREVMQRREAPELHLIKRAHRLEKEEFPEALTTHYKRNWVTAPVNLRSTVYTRKLYFRVLQMNMLLDQWTAFRRFDAHIKDEGKKEGDDYVQLNPITQLRYKMKDREEMDEVFDWDKRVERLMRDVKFYDPDIICLNEVNKVHYDRSLWKEMRELGYGCIFHSARERPAMRRFADRDLFVNKDKDPYESDMGNVVFYHKGRFFLYVDPVPVRKAIFIGLRDKIANKLLILANVKLDTGASPSDIQQRHTQVKQLLKLTKNWSLSPDVHRMSVMMLGDFSNEDYDEPCISLLRDRYSSAYDIAGGPRWTAWYNDQFWYDLAVARKTEEMKRQQQQQKEQEKGDDRDGKNGRENEITDQEKENLEGVEEPKVATVAEEEKEHERTNQNKVATAASKKEETQTERISVTEATSTPETNRTEEKKTEQVRKEDQPQQQQQQQQASPSSAPTELQSASSALPSLRSAETAINSSEHNFDLDTMFERPVVTKEEKLLQILAQEELEEELLLRSLDSYTVKERVAIRKILETPLDEEVPVSELMVLGPREQQLLLRKRGVVKRTSDFMFYEPHEISVLQVLDVPPETAIEQRLLLPNESHPSHHIPLVADFAWNTLADSDVAREAKIILDETIGEEENRKTQQSRK